MPVTLAGGLGIGVLSALCTKWFTTGFLSTLSVGMPYIVLFGVLLVFPRRYLVGKSFTVPTTRPTWRAPGSLQLTGGIALIGFLLLVPGFAGVRLSRPGDADPAGQCLYCAEKAWSGARTI